MGNYVHGYGPQENERLRDQARTLVELLHHDTAYPPGSRVLEVGCGVGAQTVTLARNSPGASITCIDISEASIDEARNRLAANEITNVDFHQADIFSMPWSTADFDHLFLCFVLEHLSEPLLALQKLGVALKPGGTITVIEGDHGSAFFHPASKAADRAIQCQVELQKAAGGNAMIGRELYPLVSRAGYKNVRVTPRLVYADESRPLMVDGFTLKTFTAMIEGVREAALGAGMIEADDFDAGIRDLKQTAGSGGVFCYTFFKAVGEKP